MMSWLRSDRRRAAIVIGGMLATEAVWGLNALAEDSPFFVDKIVPVVIVDLAAVVGGLGLLWRRDWARWLAGIWAVVAGLSAGFFALAALLLGGPGKFLVTSGPEPEAIRWFPAMNAIVLVGAILTIALLARDGPPEPSSAD